MMIEFMGRLYQDDSFRFTGFDGLKIEKLVVVEVIETKSTCLVYIKVKNHNWHRYFLDYGFAVWEIWNEETIDDKDDGYDYIDKTSELHLLAKQIVKIWCEPLDNHCQVIIEFIDYEKIILRPINSKDPESDVEFINYRF